jgi:hypothetical protein
MQHDQNVKKTAPEGTARDADYYFQLAVMLTRGNDLVGSSRPNLKGRL